MSALAICANAKCGLHFEPKRRDSRYCSRVCTKRDYDRTKRPNHRGPRATPIFDRPFNSFDGEGESPNGEGSDRFTLLADSTGRELYHDDRRRLTTEECLKFLVESPKDKANVWYGFGYDVANILYDLSQAKLKFLREHNRVWFKRYRVTWIPGKQFGVTWRSSECQCRSNRGRRKSMRCEHVKSFASYDVLGYFQSSFLQTMKGWYKKDEAEVLAMIERGKEARGNFHTWPMADVIAYNRAELAVLNDMMDNFREKLREVGYRVNAWSGAGTLAADWLKREQADKYFAPLPEEMKHAEACAFFGGRIDAAAIGDAKVNELDIQSAYPAEVANLPDMTKLTWYKVKGTIPNVGIVYCKWTLPNSVRWGPFPYREMDGSAKYPLDGEGWYHAVEVRSAVRRFPNHIQTIEAWEARGELVYPFADAVDRDYTKRALLKHPPDGSPPNPAHIPLKLGLNSLYGKFAQRAGVRVTSDGKIQLPRYHNLFYAGMITAGTRARMNDALYEIGESKVLMIATDGIFFQDKIPSALIEPDNLGSWEVDKKTNSITIAAAGMYETRDRSGEVNKNKRRGFGGNRIDFREVIRKWRRDESVTITTHRMVTLGLAAVSENYYEKRATFVTAEREMKMVGQEAFAAKRYRPMIPVYRGKLELLASGYRKTDAPSAPYQILRARDLRRDDKG